MSIDDNLVVLPAKAKKSTSSKFLKTIQAPFVDETGSFDYHKKIVQYLPHSTFSFLVYRGSLTWAEYFTLPDLTLTHSMYITGASFALGALFLPIGEQYAVKKIGDRPHKFLGFPVSTKTKDRLIDTSVFLISTLVKAGVYYGLESGDIESALVAGTTVGVASTFIKKSLPYFAQNKKLKYSVMAAGLTSLLSFYTYMGADTTKEQKKPIPVETTAPKKQIVEPRSQLPKQKEYSSTTIMFPLKKLQTQ